MGQIRLLAHSGLTMIEVMATCIMRGVQPLQYRGHPMWDFNGEDDATRHGPKVPGSAADLIKILSTLYKGEEEEFLRVNPQGGFSMYNPPSWVSGDFFSPIRFIFPQLSVQSSNFYAGTAPGCKGDKQPPSTTRGPWTVPRPGLPRRSGHICGADRWGVLPIEQ